MLGPLTLIAFVAVFRTVSIKLAGPHAAIDILSSLFDRATTSLIKPATSGLPGAMSSDIELSQGFFLVLCECFVPFFSMSRSKVAWWVVGAVLATGEVTGNSWDFSGSMGEDGESTGVEWPGLCVCAGEEVAEGRVVCRKKEMWGEDWSSVNSFSNQERVSVIR